MTGCQLIKRKVNIMPPPVRKKTARSSGKGSFMDSIMQVLRICDHGRVSSLNGGKAISKCVINVSIGPGSRLQCSYFRASAISKTKHNLDFQEISLTNAKRLLCNPGNCWLAAIVLLAAELVLNTVMIVVKLGPKVIEYISRWWYMGLSTQRLIG